MWSLPDVCFCNCYRRSNQQDPKSVAWLWLLKTQNCLRVENLSKLFLNFSIRYARQLDLSIYSMQFRLQDTFTYGWFYSSETYLNRNILLHLIPLFFVSFLMHFEDGEKLLPLNFHSDHTRTWSSQHLWDLQLEDWRLRRPMTITVMLNVFKNQFPTQLSNFLRNCY